MRKALNYLMLLLIVVAQPALARIGETIGQCTQRYGQPTLRSENSVFFYKSPFFIQTVISHKKVVNIVYYKVQKSKLGPDFSEHLQKITQAEIDALLSANSTSEWVLNERLRLWKTSDGKLQAMNPSNGGALIISDIEGSKDKASSDSDRMKSNLSEF